MHGSCTCQVSGLMCMTNWMSFGTNPRLLVAQRVWRDVNCDYAYGVT